MTSLRIGARLLAGLAFFLASSLGHAQPAASNRSAVAPVAKAAPPAEVLLSDGAAATLITLDSMDPAIIESAKGANGERFAKRLQIGLHRDVPASRDSTSAGLAWTRVAGGSAARWQVLSPGARALRVGLVTTSPGAGLQVRVSGGDGPVYGPFAADDLASMGPVFWSPVVEGERAIVELFVAEGSLASAVDVTLAQVSHLFVSPSDPRAETFAKASQACEVDLICRSATDAALAATGKAVARMTFSDGMGSYLCTGTLLNPVGGSFTPYFYSANHCISLQSVANTLTTHWFYDATACGSGLTSPSYVQVSGGATILYNNALQDALFMRLNASPPAGAVFAGWNAATLSNGTALTGVHHPSGDLKKVSLATMGGFATPYAGLGNLIDVLWNSTLTGVTEGGSSGSGIFTAVGAPATDYQLRGGLYGGPSSCSASGADLRDYYSRFDQVYPSIASFLNPAPANYTLNVSVVGAGTVSSSPAGINGCGSACSAPFAAGTTITLTATPLGGYVFSGWSGGSCSGGGTTCSFSIGATQTVTATFVAASADVSITNTLNANPASSGKDAVFTMTASNAGPNPATGVNVIASYDAAATVIWATPGCSAAGAGLYQCPAGTLAAGQSVQYKLVLRKNAAGTVYNNAGVTSTTPDPNAANNAANIGATVNASPAGVQVQRYRLFSPVTNEHLYTTDLNEYNTLGSFVGTWNQEGPVGKVLNNPGSFNGVAATPYYRLYNTSNAQHHWTTDANEYYTLLLFPQYTGEGVDGYIFPTQAAGTIPLYRLLYPFSVPVSGLHHWTIDPVEYGQLISVFGWIGEGGSGFVIP